MIIGLFTLFIYSIEAQASVVLNEVAIQPNQIVELYNNASESADISSWYIDDAGGTTYYTVPTQTTLPPRSCLLFNADFNFNKSSADSVRLFDNTAPPTSSSAKLIEQYSYTKSPEINYSFSKKTDGGVEWQMTSSSLGMLNESLLSCIPTPSPTSFPSETPTPIPTIPLTPTLEPTQTPAPTSKIDYQNVYISEVYPYPRTGEKEWIEIYNGNNFQINLDHWYIDDSENSGSTPKSFTLLLDPLTYGVLDMSSSLFNNDGDVVRLLNGEKIEKDSMEYGKITQGKSIGRISFEEDSYCEQEPSKNTINSLCLLEEGSPAVLQPNSSIQKTSITQKTIIPTKKIQNQPQINTNMINETSVKETNINQKGEVLSAQTQNSPNTSPVPHLSFVSFSYSLLTIVSVFIKMKNA